MAVGLIWVVSGHHRLCPGTSAIEQEADMVNLERNAAIGQEQTFPIYSGWISRPTLAVVQLSASARRILGASGLDRKMDGLSGSADLSQPSTETPP